MITKINSVAYTNNNQHKQPSFKGGRLNVIKYALNPFKKVSRSMLNSCLYLDKDVIQLEKAQSIKNPVENVNKPLNRHKAGFLYRLANKFQNESFEDCLKMKNLQEKRQLVYDMYYKVKYPSFAHKAIAADNAYSLREANQIFELMNKDNSKIELAQNLIKTFRSQTIVSIPAESLITILSSDSCKILNKKYSEVEKFILKQWENEDFSMTRLPALLELFAKGCK